MTNDPFGESEYQYKQRMRSLFKFQEAYEVSNPNTKEKFFYGKRDRLWLKKDAHVFIGENDKGEKLLTMKDESIFDAFGSFAAIDNQGNLQARFRRKFWRSAFWRETWLIEDANGNQVGKMSAKGGFFKTLIRKFNFLTFIPVIGSLLDMMMRLHYQFLNAEGEVYAEYSRKFSIRDFYKLQFLDESKMNIPKEAVIGICFLLDSAEDR